MREIAREAAMRLARASIKRGGKLAGSIYMVKRMALAVVEFV